MLGHSSQYNTVNGCYVRGGQATDHYIIQLIAVTVQPDRPQITTYYSAWHLRYRRTGHRTPNYRAHGINCTGGQATFLNIIQRMLVTVEMDRSHITISSTLFRYIPPSSLHAPHTSTPPTPPEECIDFSIRNFAYVCIFD